MERPASLPKTLPPRVLPSVDARIDPSGFLEKRSYRSRRITDALRLLPIFGLWLFLIPIFWPGGPDAPNEAYVSMSSALVYIFAVWAALIVGCALLSVRHGRSANEVARTPEADTTQQDSSGFS